MSFKSISPEATNVPAAAILKTTTSSLAQPPAILSISTIKCNTLLAQIHQITIHSNAITSSSYNSSHSTINTTPPRSITTMSSLPNMVEFYYQEARIIYYRDAHTRYYREREMDIAIDIAKRLAAACLFPNREVFHEMVAGAMICSEFVRMGIWG
ncbi:hypothetical protein EJ08DRAFT_695324 [Tothia fuscella]|uniref:Uncharacterized protein n=1 Tax=Tothia fuscella TaxID=1048955 RepID=A0A9P4U142_9PEZI|nr:hypothetical protein EJ08DRAFT_695324 [Tothia fuscella]